jgi:hypothetical protein
LIAVLTDPAVGGTFLTWSLHYLAGHDRYYCVERKVWEALPDNPLTERNSHGFTPNQPNNRSGFDNMYPLLNSIPAEGFHSIYFHNFDYSTESADPNMQAVLAELEQDQLVLLTCAPAHQRYQTRFQRRSGMSLSWAVPGQVLDNDWTGLDDYVDHFFKESADVWRQSNLTEIWDQREFFALNGVYKTAPSILPNVDLTREHYRMDTMDLWNTFDDTVDLLFDSVKQTVDSTRRDSWNKIYQAWRKVHYKNMLFVWYFDDIIDYIVNGYSMDLTKFDLDIVQEASIQHELIYKHNLNLKTWQLEKFTNTKQLHNLLEPNIHPLKTV